MPPSNWRIRLNSVCIASLGVALVLPFAGGQTSTTNPPAKKTTSFKGKTKAADPVPDGPPMTLDYTVKMLNGVKEGLIPAPRVLAFINKRNIDFEATPDNLAKLMTAGATAELLDRVFSLKPPAPPPPPPPPPKPITGTISLLCTPAECMIRMDGGPDKVTTSGRLSISNLVYKQYLVDFRKDGYMPMAKKITVSSETGPEIAVTLDVLPETRAKWGQQLYTSALQALGGPNRLAEFKSITAVGGASSWNEQGSQTEWTVKTNYSGDTTSYELTNPTSGVYAIVCQDETCNPPKGRGPKGKKASGPEADALNTNLRQYNRYRLITLMQRISTGNHKLGSAAIPSATNPNHLLVTSPDESYDITLDAGYLPIAVTYRSSDGLASAKITYSEYETFGTAAKYPHLTSISLPGDKQHGIRVKYNTVTPK